MAIISLPGQLALPDCEPDQKLVLRRLAAATMKPTTPQKPCDVGLFSDEAAQIDLVEMLQQPVED